MKNKIGICALVIMLATGTQVSAKEPVYDCINASDKSDDGYSKCYLAETKRLSEEIKQKYNKLAENPQLTQWNNGNGMFKGNLKDMFDSWIAFRNRFCSLSGISGNHYNGESKTFHQSDCLYQLSKEHNDQLDGIISNLVSQMINDGTPTIRD